MEIYLIVPDDLKKTYGLYEQCQHLFSRQKERIFMYSSFNEKCISLARGIALCIGEISFSVDPDLDRGDSGIKEFSKKHYWPNYFVQIIVVPADIAKIVAKFIDPGCAFDAISTDTIFRLKDIEVPEITDEEVE